MNEYPKIVTERFDGANFHIKYCLKFINKYLKGNILFCWSHSTGT